MLSAWLVLFHPIFAQWATPRHFCTEMRLYYSYQQLIFIEYLLCAKYIACIISFNLYTNPWLIIVRYLSSLWLGDRGHLHSFLDLMQLWLIPGCNLKMRWLRGWRRNKGREGMKKERIKTNLLTCLPDEKTEASFLLIPTVTFKGGMFISPMLNMRKLSSRNVN